jgi:hypothetical protein
MRLEMKSSFEVWHVASSGKKKQNMVKEFAEGRFKCSMQRQINNNKISKDKL